MNFQNLVGEERGSGSAALKRSSALTDTRAPAQPCSDDTELMELLMAPHQPQSLLQDAGTRTHRSPSAHRLLGGCLFTHTPQALALLSLGMHLPSLLGSSVKSPCFKEALQPSPQPQCLAIPQSCTNPSRYLATPAKGNKDFVRLYLI